MSKTLVIQSYKDGIKPLWIEHCLESVRQLCMLRKWDYRLIGDELFEPLPKEFVLKVGQRGPILSDLGRLITCKEALKHYQEVIWLDADIFIFNHAAFRLPQGQFGFGKERWVQHKLKGHKLSWKIYRSVCNALCYFQRDNPFLDFYIYTCESIIKRVDPAHIAPQIIGPKLLSALHSIAFCPLSSSIGSASPDLMIDLRYGEGEALELHRADVNPNEPESGLNLCHSLIGSETYRPNHPMQVEEILLGIEHLRKFKKV